MNERINKLLDSIDVNPKIRELAEQSGCKIDKLGFGEGNLEKFAELIVRECAFEAFKFWLAQGDCNDESAQAHIKEHFGVEE
jgi:hypothetical protein